MKKIDNNVKYYQKSNDKKSTVYEIEYMGMLVGTLVVPNAKNKQLEFVADSRLKTVYARKILKVLYAKFHRNIFVKGLRKSFVFSFADTKPKNVKETKSWVRYRNNINQYIGKYCEFNDNGKVGIELVLKKLIKTDDAVYTVHSLLKKYPVIKLTVAQIMSNPIEINDSMSRDEIQTKIVCVLTWGQTKQAAEKATITPVKTVQEKQVDNKPAVVATKEVETPSQEFSHNIDPMILAKTLTLTMGHKQNIDDAKKKAQTKADDLHICIKLLDKDGHFVSNFYPNISEQVRIEKIKRLAQKALGE